MGGRVGRGNPLREKMAVTAEVFWTSWVAFWLLAGPIILCYVIFFYSLYLSRYHLDDFLNALKNSRHIVVSTAGAVQGGWLSRVLLVATITFMVMWPGPGLRTGELDPADISNFPRGLKRLLKIKATLTCVALIWGGVVFPLAKFR